MKKLYRSQADKKIAGIFGGMAEVYSVDPSLLRLIAVFLGLATGALPLLITYLVGWVIIPKSPLPTDLRTQPPPTNPSGSGRFSD